MKKIKSSYNKAKNMLENELKKISIECKRAKCEPPTIELKLVGSRIVGKREAWKSFEKWQKELCKKETGNE